MDLNNDSYLEPFELMISLRIKDIYKFLASGEMKIDIKNMTTNITYAIDMLKTEFVKNHTWILNDLDYKFLHYVISNLSFLVKL